MAQYEQRTCDLGNMQGCEGLARTYRIGFPGVGQNIEKAEAIYNRACDGGQAGACLDLAILYQWGEGVAYDPKRAEHYLGKACRASELVCKAMKEGAPLGTIDVDRLRETVHNDETIDRCLTMGHEARGGWMAFSFAVDIEGKATDLRVLGTTADSISRCVADRLQSLLYPQAVGGSSWVAYVITTGSDGEIIHEKPASSQSIRMVTNRAQHTPNPSLESLKQVVGERRQEVTSRIYFCVDPSGEVTKVREIQEPVPAFPEMTEVVLDTVKSWRFVPVLVDGTAVTACTVYTFGLRFKEK